MKKKIIALALCVAMFAVAAVSSTLAFFTDTDFAENVFTVGKVDIEIEEEFNREAKLFPGVKVDKKTYIVLGEDSEDAYVWFEYLVPHALNDPQNVYYSNDVDPALHVNIRGAWCYNFKYHRNDWWRDNYDVGIGEDPIVRDEYLWDYDPAHEATNINYPEGVGKISLPAEVEANDYGYIGQETVGDVFYDKYVGLYVGKLSNSEDGQQKTSQSLSSVYFSDNVDFDDGITFNGEAIEDMPDPVKVIVRAYAIQAEGFNDVYEAYEAYQNKKATP